MSIKYDVTLKEALEAVSIVQEAANNNGEEIKILDVGGGYKPLVFATHVIDMIKFAARASEGTYPEEATKSACRVTEENWKIHDINITPWLYEDKEFDIVWCSDVLGMIRDPISVVSELCRVGKSGFVRVIHRNYESLHGVEDDDTYAGYQLNRWLIEPFGDALLFTFKHPYIHFQTQNRALGIKYINFWWTDTFYAYENILNSGDKYISEFNIYAEECTKIAEGYDDKN